MKQIKLRPELLELVKQGVKTRTFREGVRDYTLGICELVNNQEGSDKVIIEITGLKLMRLKDVSPDMLDSSYKDLSHFQDNMKSIYPGIVGNTVITVVEFKEVAF